MRSYGGHAAFKVDIMQTMNGPIWQIVIDDPKLMQVWPAWMNEKTAQLVNLTDVDQLDEPTKLAYRVSKSVNLKLKDAAAKPQYEPQRFVGSITLNAQGAPTLAIEGQDQQATLTGAALNTAKTFVGKRVVVEGTVKIRGEIDTTAVFERRDGVLEVFVIAHCPFGKSAEKAIIERLTSKGPGGGTADMPKVEFRYLFLPVAGGSQVAFTCLHGEPEAEENLVQMLIRDQFPSRFFDYLLRRAASDAPWEELATAVGLDEFAVAVISSNLTGNRTALMAAEHAYAKSRNVPFLSPAYLYEGRVVTALDAVPGMKGVVVAPGNCGG